MIASLMMLAVAALAIPTLAAELHTPAAAHENALERGVRDSAAHRVFVAACPSRSAPTPSERCVTRQKTATPHGAWPLWLAITVLVVASLGAAVVSEWFVSALEPAIKTLHISQAFAGHRDRGDRGQRGGERGRHSSGGEESPGLRDERHPQQLAGDRARA